MKKVISIVIAVIITAVIVLGGLALYTHFAKPDEKQNINSIKPGEIVSEKYGTFVIPEENMFFSLNMGGLIAVDNNTDFTYLFDEFMDEIARINKVEEVAKFKEDNQMLFKTALQLEYNVPLAPTLADPNYPFLNSTAYSNTKNGSNFIYLALKDNKLQYDIKKHLEITSFPYPFLELTYINKENLSNATDGMVDSLYGLSYDEITYANMSVRCLGRKVTMSVEGQDDITYILPVMIISDKGYPMTEKVYEEIKKGI